MVEGRPKSIGRSSRTRLRVALSVLVLAGTTWLTSPSVSAQGVSLPSPDEQVTEISPVVEPLTTTDYRSEQYTLITTTMELTDRLQVEGIFGGSRFTDGGNRLTIGVKGPLSKDTASLLALLDPLTKSSVNLVRVSHSLDELSVIAGEVLNQLVQGRPDLKVYGVAPDPELGSIRLLVDAATLPAAEAQLQALSDRFKVRVDIEISEEFRPAACISRTSCTSPMRAGTTSGAGCTMGFHVWSPGGNAEFMTAGHCTPVGNETFTHAGITLGTRQNTIYVQSGRDAAAVLFVPGFHHSNQVFATSETNTLFVNGLVNHWNVPNGTWVCKSGVVGDYDCSQTAEQNFWYWLAACGCSLQGARAADSLGILGGDSGGPVFIVGPGSTALAYGIVSTTGGAFAQVGSSITELNRRLRTS